MNSPSSEPRDKRNATGPSTIGERRPIASRNTGWAQCIASALALRGVSPNAISVASMFFGTLAGACFVGSAQVEGLAARTLLVGAAAGIQLRLLCNLFDGMVAVHAQRFSPSGELYNEAPDRVSDAAILIGAGYAVGSMPELGYLAAIVAIFVAYARAMGKIVSGKQDFRGPMAKPQRMAVMTIAALCVALAPTAWQPQWGKANLGAIGLALSVVIVGGLWTAWRRLSSAAAECASQAAAKASASPIASKQESIAEPGESERPTAP